MSRYFFHAENGRRVTDDRGDELASLTEARAHGVRFLCEMLPVLGEELWTTGVARILVTDEDQLVLFTLDVSATTAPVARRS